MNTSFHGFLGQAAIIRSLKDHCTGAISKGEPLPHLLLMGSSGFGKSHLASAVASELGTTCISIFASPQTKRWSLSLELSKMQKKGDVCFIDEVHSLPDSVQEVLYPAIDNLRVPLVDPETHRIVENEWVSIAPFTLVCASDQPGKLKNALCQRLVLRYTLTGYSEDEMRQIVSNRASETGLLLSPQGCRRIAQASRGVPRRVRHLLLSLRTVMEDPSVRVTRAMVTKHLASLGIDDDNLGPDDRGYLAVLVRRGGYVSLETVALQLGLDEVSVKRTESFLIQMELISVDSRGRCLTPKGIVYCAERRLAR